MHIAMTDRGSRQTNFHLARLWWSDINLFDNQRLTKGVADSCFHQLAPYSAGKRRLLSCIRVARYAGQQRSARPGQLEELEVVFGIAIIHHLGTAKAIITSKY